MSFEIEKGRGVRKSAQARGQTPRPLLGTTSKRRGKRSRRRRRNRKDLNLLGRKNRSVNLRNLSSESKGSHPFVASVPIQLGLSKSTSSKLRYLWSQGFSFVHEERRERLVIAVLDLIAHRLQVKDVKLINDTRDGLPLHERTFDRVLGVCLQCDVTAVQRARRHLSQRGHIDSSEGEEEDAGGEGGRSTGVTVLGQQYTIVPDPEQRIPYTKGVNHGHEWTKLICRVLEAVYRFKAHYFINCGPKLEGIL